MGGGMMDKDALMSASQVETCLPAKSLSKTKAKASKGKQSSPKSTKGPRSVKSNKAASSVNVQHVLNQNHGRRVNPAWVLLDNQSTVDLFYNPRLLHNIRKSNHHMDIHCNAGVTLMSLVGDLPSYGEVWFHKNGIANILSLANVKEKYRITHL
jgi:hypothetical protein